MWRTLLDHPYAHERRGIGGAFIISGNRNDISINGESPHQQGRNKLRRRIRGKGEKERVGEEIGQGRNCQAMAKTEKGKWQKRVSSPEMMFFDSETI